MKRLTEISADVTCENCEAEVEVMLHAGSPGQPDPNKPNPCPPTPAFNDPSECPECGHPLLIDDIATRLYDEQEAAEDWRAECKLDEMRNK
jgi:hypothetical protein